MQPLNAEKLACDARVVQAKSLLRAALADAQRAVTGVRPPHSERKLEYEEALARLNAVRGSPTYYPYLGSGFGRGCLVELADGSVKYDFIAGIGVHFLGHNHPDLLEAGVDAALQNTVMQGHLQQNRDGLEFLESLVQGANRRGAQFAHGVMTTSGAMANENAVKIAFQKRHPASRILAFRHNFAGRTLDLAQITDKPAYREGLPRNLPVDYVPFYDPVRPEASSEEAVAMLRGHLERHPHAHAAMIFEWIQGEAGGYAAGTRAFFVPLLETARRAGVVIIADEIQTFGRTDELFAFQHFGLDPYVDIVTLGKMTQACATLFTAAQNPKPGLISQTYTASTSAIRAGLRVVKALLHEGYLGPDGRIMRVSSRLREGLADLERRHPQWVRGPYGLGALVAFTPFDGSAAITARVCRTLFDLGVIVFTAGGDPARVRFLPPVGGVEDHDVDCVLELLEAALDRCA